MSVSRRIEFPINLMQILNECAGKKERVGGQREITGVKVACLVCTKSKFEPNITIWPS